MPLKKRLRRALTRATMLVDAHNVCFRDPALAALMHDDSERARAALAARVHRARERTVLFCDGGPMDRKGLHWRQGLRLVYTGAASADDLLIRHLDRHNEPGEFLVVTDDATLAGRARARHAQVCPASVYLEWLGDEAKAADGNPAERLPDAAEVDFWVRRFEGE